MEIEKSARLLYLYQDFIKGVGIQKKAAANFDRFSDENDDGDTQKRINEQ